MAKTPKTAPELERYILGALRTSAACSAISAVTVTEAVGLAEGNWQVSHISIPGEVVPALCRDICATAVERLRQHYDLVTDIEAGEL